MAFVNYNNKEITVKIVYYGPALSGKTTCLKNIYASKKFEKKGKLITLDTDGDRTLFFDFLPLEIGKLGDYSVKMQLYTVPGQVAYDTTRKLVLQGADGVVFVADSQVIMKDQNIESFKNLKDNIELNNISFSDLPIIIQYNKRDLKEILPLDNLNSDLNPDNKPFFPTIATTGENIIESLHTIMKNVIIHLKNKLSIFQKDKTVMFSREEVTSTSTPNDVEEEISQQDDDDEINIHEVTDYKENDDVFELSGSMKESRNIDSPPDKFDDNEIFNLNDHNILQNADSEFEVPDVDLIGELEEEKPVKVLRQKKTGIAEKKEKSIPTRKSTSVIENIEIPLKVDMPDDQDEVCVNLNLKIVIKKK